VGHAAGQAPDGFHLLRLSELFRQLLRPLSFGDVEVTADHPHRRAAGVAYGEASRVDPAIRAVLVAQAELNGVLRSSPLEISTQRLDHGLAIVGVQPVFPLLVPGRDLVWLVAELTLPFGREVHRVGVKVPVPDSEVRRPNRQSKPLLALQQRLFGLLSLSDVATNGENVRPAQMVDE
jgi:hypothetical protein